MSAARVAGSGVNSTGSSGASSTTAAPSSAPARTPQRTIRVVVARTAAGSPAPSALPVSACAAIARASRENVRNDQIVNATWWAASGTAPNPAATHTVSSRIARRASVRTMSGTPSSAARRTPAGWTARRAPSRRAIRSRATTNTAAMAVCATTVPRAEPATPQPNP